MVKNIVKIACALILLFPFYSHAKTTDCSCIDLVRQLSSYQPPRLGSNGWASQITVKSLIPKVGSWILFDNYKNGFNRGHTGLTLTESYKIKGISLIDYIDQYKINGECVIKRRTIRIDDPKIRGYYYDLPKLAKTP